MEKERDFHQGCGDEQSGWLASNSKIMDVYYIPDVLAENSAPSA